MIVLDTNVISELLRPAPDPKVKTWFRYQNSAELYMTAVSEAELRRGAIVMESGKKRDKMVSAMESILDGGFQGGILPFDSAAAKEYVRIWASRRSEGRPISNFDGQIAAIACERNAEIATRNVRHFEGCGIRVINPWNQ